MQLLAAPIVVGLLIITYQSRPVAATEPTPTPSIPDNFDPSGNSSEDVCGLALGSKCEFPKRDDLAGSTLERPKTYPAPGARDVPTYTLISVTFGRDMNLNTINNETFQVSQGDRQLAGSIRYIDASRMAVFDPGIPLRPNTTYTARVAGGVQDGAGYPLAEEIVWSFTTTDGTPPLGGDLTAADEDVSAMAMHFYTGDLHGHTGYSDGQGTPADAFATARANGMDFFGTTDHDIMLTETEWQDTLAQANAVTVNGSFIALRGFEFSHARGHLNVFESDTFVRGDDPTYADLAAFYDWLVDQPVAFAQFNHPALGVNFNDFAFHSAADQKIVLRELTTANQFFLSMDKGWHLGTLANSDTHQANWGCCPLMGVWAPALTKSDILEALKARRTIFLSPDDNDFTLALQANGYWMGSAIPNTGTINFVITASDRNPDGRSLRLALYENGVRIASTTLSSASSYRWTPARPASLGHYYYAEAYYDGWYYPAYSSPIWVERSPVAEAGPSQVVATGATVSLDGHGSWDPDGDALAYQWTQASGPPVNFSGAQSALPVFIAPDTVGDLEMELMVIDTGGLSDSDTIQVTVTDKPILAISKHGPATAELGERITYTLTVTNNGRANASNLVVRDVIPAGATYVAGGDNRDGVVYWELPELGSHESAEVTFVVTSDQPLANTEYGASCADCFPAVGDVIVFTNARKIYMPLIFK